MSFTWDFPFFIYFSTQKTFPEKYLECHHSLSNISFEQWIGLTYLLSFYFYITLYKTLPHTLIYSVSLTVFPLLPFSNRVRTAHGRSGHWIETNGESSSTTATLYGICWRRRIGEGQQKFHIRNLITRKTRKIERIIHRHYKL